MNNTYEPKKSFQLSPNISQVTLHFRKAEFPSWNYPQSDHVLLMHNVKIT